jgi:hypothetical protein
MQQIIVHCKSFGRIRAELHFHRRTSFMPTVMTLWFAMATVSDIAKELNRAILAGYWGGTGVLLNDDSRRGRTAH